MSDGIGDGRSELVQATKQQIKQWIENNFLIGRKMLHGGVTVRWLSYIGPKKVCCWVELPNGFKTGATTTSLIEENFSVAGCKKRRKQAEICADVQTDMFIGAVV